MRANAAGGNSVAAVLIVGLLLIVSMGAIAITTTQPGLHLQIFLLLLFFLPAIILAFANSRHLLVYILCVWAFGPEVRRIVDWAQGEYQPMALLSLAPFLATTVLLIPIALHPAPLAPPLRKALLFFGLAIGYGTIIGAARNGLSFVFDFGNYVLPFLLALYGAKRYPDTAERDRWIASLSTIAVIVSIYGWFQYLTMPAWDAFWMRHSGLTSIGWPYPMRFRVFSTLNAPVQAGVFLAAALGPMLLNRRWRGRFGWVGVVLVASVLGITLVRTSWLTLTVFLTAYLLAVPLRQSWRVVGAVACAGILVFAVMPFLPGNQAVTTRLQSLTNLREDKSYTGRLAIAAELTREIVRNPVGNGIGGSGLTVTRFSDKNKAALNIDNGFYLIYLDFGLPGTLAFFYGIWLMMAAIRESSRALPKLSEHGRVARAAMVASVLSLASAHFFLGVSGVMVWFFVGSAVATMPARVRVAPRSVNPQPGMVQSGTSLS